VFYYRRPDSVRWQYSLPDSSWTVLRGERGWSVFPGIRQVRNFALKGEQVDALLSIIGFGACGSRFQAAFAVTMTTSAAGAYVLALVPREPEIAARFHRIDLTLDPRDYLPRRVVMHEISGDTEQFEFLDLQRGAPVGADLFEYTWPQGYEVVE